MKEKTENYQQLGAIRFRKDISDQRWQINLSDVAAMFPPSQSFKLETWLENREGLDDLITTDGDEFLGVYAISLELARIPNSLPPASLFLGKILYVKFDRPLQPGSR